MPDLLQPFFSYMFSLLKPPLRFEMEVIPVAVVRCFHLVKERKGTNDTICSFYTHHRPPRPSGDPINMGTGVWFRGSWERGGFQSKGEISAVQLY
jgi:hypothetical protein